MARLLKLSHKSLDAWKEAMLLLKLTYKETSFFPLVERYGLTAHCRKTATSIVSNIAEGASRKTMKEKARFFEIARSSLVELDTQFEIAESLGYMNHHSTERLVSSFGKTFALISGLIKANRK
ncbi:MAG: four helix bundle protein [Calditrichia bacterium]